MLGYEVRKQSHSINLKWSLKQDFKIPKCKRKLSNDHILKGVRYIGKEMLLVNRVDSFACSNKDLPSLEVTWPSLLYMEV